MEQIFLCAKPEYMQRLTQEFYWISARSIKIVLVSYIPKESDICKANSLFCMSSRKSRRQINTCTGCFYIFVKS